MIQLILALTFFLPADRQIQQLNAEKLLSCSDKEVTEIDAYLQKNGYKFMNQSNPDGAGFEFLYDYANGKGETFEVIASGVKITQFIFDIKNQEESIKLLEEFKTSGFVLDEKEGEKEKLKKSKHTLTYKKIGNIYDFNLRFKY